MDESFSKPVPDFTPSPPPVASSGTRVALLVAASLLLAAGVLALLFALFLWVVAPGLTVEDPASLRLGGLGLLMMGLVTLGLGLGLLWAKRWARRLGVLLAMGMLALGILSFTTALATIPDQAGFAVGLAVGLLLLVPFVAAPLALWILLSRKALIAHIEAKDPLPGWTEHHPLPLLGLILFLGSGVLGILQAFFPPAQMDALLRAPLGLWKSWSLVAALVSGGLAWGLWKRDPRAWWAALVWFPLSSLVGWLMLGAPGDAANAATQPALVQGLAVAKRTALLWPLVMMGWVLWVRSSVVGFRETGAPDA